MYKYLLLLCLTLFGYSQNLITNNSFETFTGTADDATTDVFTDWVSSFDAGGSIIAVTDAQSGSVAVKIIRTTNGSTLIQQQSISVIADTAYTLTFYLKGDGATQIYVRVNDGTSNLLNEYVGYNGSSAYQLITKTINTGASSSSIYIRFFCLSANSIGFIDNVSLTLNVPDVINTFKKNGFRRPFATGFPKPFK